MAHDTNRQGTTVEDVRKVVDALFSEHENQFGPDYEIYRAHVHRVVGLVALQVEIPAELVQPVGVAAFFHDAGIWLDQTWDYLEPSCGHALRFVDDHSHDRLVQAIIVEHHRVRRAKHQHPIVEAFRKADRTDLFFGFPPIRGISRQDYKSLMRTYPAKGFRPMLLRAFRRGIREQPWNPLPMIKL